MPVCSCCLNELSGPAEDNYPPDDVTILETPTPGPRSSQTGGGPTQLRSAPVTRSPGRNASVSNSQNTTSATPGPSTSASSGSVIQSRRETFFNDLGMKFKGKTAFEKSRSLTDVSCLPCGHIFHTRCLQEWFISPSGRKNCPHCLKPVVISKIIKAFIPEEDYKPVNSKIVTTRSQSLHNITSTEKLEKAENEKKKLALELASLKRKLSLATSDVLMESLNTELERLRQENQNLKAEIRLYTQESESSENKSVPAKRSRRET